MSKLDRDMREMFRATVSRVVGGPAMDRMEGGRDRTSLWREMGATGLIGLGLPEWAGGLDGGMVDLGIVMRAIGGSLLAEPYAATAVIAGPLLARRLGEQAREVLEPLASGQTVMAFAHFEPALGFARGPITSRAIKQDGHLTISGTKFFVLNAMAADAFVVSAIDPAGALGLYLVPADVQGLHIEEARSVDGRTVCTLHLKHVPVQQLGEGDATKLVEEALDRATAACCAEALGAMACVVDRTKEYVQTRKAFGRTLSKFQVLQHRLVDMLIALEEARAVVAAAEAACDEESNDRAQVISACKVTVSRAARFIGSQGIQLHGGVGMTTELIISHYYKRLMMLEACFGNADHHLDVYAARCSNHIDGEHLTRKSELVPA